MTNRPSEGGGSIADQPPPTPAAYIRMVLIGAVIGLPAAMLAVLFLIVVEFLEDLLWTELPSALGTEAPPWYLLIGLPVVGALFVAGARILLPGDGGHPPLEGLTAAPTPIVQALGVALAAIGTLAFGAVLGPEMPVIALGSVAGLAVTRAIRVDARERTVLAAAGSFSAISALFGGPIVAGLMLTEAGVGLGKTLIPALLPGFVAAAIGYLIFVGVGDWTGLPAPGLTVPGLEPYEGTFVVDLLMAVVVGLVTALILALIRRGARRIADRGGERLGVAPLLVVGGFTVGLVAVLAGALGVDPLDVLFSGQKSIPALVATESTVLLVILLGAKGLAYAVSLATGFRGGPIFPAVFVGIGIAIFPVLWIGMSATVAIAMGAAAGMAAQTRLVVTSMLFGALLVGTAGIDAVPAAVLAAVAAWVGTAALERGPGAA